MSPSKLSLLIVGIASIGLGVAAARFAVAAPAPVADLASNEGIFVDVKTFKIVKGAAKGDPSAQIVKLGAREVKEGAIIFRAGDKLYIVDANPEGSRHNAFSTTFENAWPTL